jgi:hypothetical protein
MVFYVDPVLVCGFCNRLWLQKKEEEKNNVCKQKLFKNGKRSLKMLKNMNDENNHFIGFSQGK